VEVLAEEVLVVATAAGAVSWEGRNGRARAAEVEREAEWVEEQAWVTAVATGAQAPPRSRCQTCRVS